MNLNEIEERIVATLHKIPVQLKEGARDSLWTQAIKLSLGQLGSSTNYGVCTAGLREHFDREWLYDLCWYISTPEGQLLEMLLALESEWNRQYEEIKYDFEKLLIGRAKIKVMLFQASGNTVVEYFDRLELGIKTYRGGNTGEVYLLACFDEQSWEFKIRRVDGV